MSKAVSTIWVLQICLHESSFLSIMFICWSNCVEWILQRKTLILKLNVFFITRENVLTCTAQIPYNRNSISKVWEHLFPLSSSNFAVFRCVTLLSGSHSPFNSSVFVFFRERIQTRHPKCTIKDKVFLILTFSLLLYELLSASALSSAPGLLSSSRSILSLSFKLFIWLIVFFIFNILV